MTLNLNFEFKIIPPPPKSTQLEEQQETCASTKIYRKLNMHKVEPPLKKGVMNYLRRSDSGDYMVHLNKRCAYIHL